MKYRKGLGKGLGRGYLNLMPIDSHIHSLSALGVKSVSVPRYMGKWNAQGSFPTWFEKGCTKSKAKYTLREDGKIDVENSCIEKGKRRYTKGVARSVSENNKKLKVSFFPLIEGDYIIEYLDKDYQNVIVGHPDKNYLWIMSRDEKIPEKKYNELVEIAKQRGYDVSKIKTLNAKFTYENGGLVIDGGDEIYQSLKRINEQKAREKEAMSQMYGTMLNANADKEKIERQLVTNPQQAEDVIGYSIGIPLALLLLAKGENKSCPNKRLDLKKPTVEVLSEKDFEKRFEDDYAENEVGYATTKILPNGEVNVYLKDSGDYTRNGKLLMHELKELEIWKELINEKCMNPNIADEMAHNLNPVKVEGVSDTYELDASN